MPVSAVPAGNWRALVFTDLFLIDRAEETFRKLLHDLFEANILRELETQRARPEQSEGGAWQVTIDVRAPKVVVAIAGVETRAEGPRASITAEGTCRRVGTGQRPGSH